MKGLPERRGLITCQDWDDYASIYPHMISKYWRKAVGYQFGEKHELNRVNLLNNEHQGNISKKAQKRIENGINWLLFKAKPKRVYDSDSKRYYSFRINLITLTLSAPQVHKDQKITNRCLNNFLNVIRNNYGVSNYLWRAEAQPGTNNIHYHITTDTYIHYKDVRRIWNQSQELLGYVSAFQKVHGHRDPNSTDIHSVKNIRKIAAYLSKYLAKDKRWLPIGELRSKDGKTFEVLYGSKKYRREAPGKKDGIVVGAVVVGPIRKLEGRLWYCSRSISQSKPLIINQHCYQWVSLQELINSGNFHKHEHDHGEVYYGQILTTAKKVAPGFYEDVIKHTKDIRIDYGQSDSNKLQYLK